MSELELLRRLAPPVDPAPAEACERVRAGITRAPARGRGRLRRRALVAVPLVAAASLALGLAGTQLGGDGQRAWAAEVVRAAETAPRLLIADGAWPVTRADEWQAGTGEMTFGSGPSQLELRWSRDRGQPAVPDLKAAPGDSVSSATVMAATAQVVRYAGSDTYRAVWSDGSSTLVAQGAARSPEAFADLLGRLEKVSVDDWLSALPASAVAPPDRGSAVTGMLDGLPIPPGLDVAALGTSTATRDRYQLGAQVAGAVACGWFAQWVEATAAGDAAAAGRAVDALATSHQWPVLLAMQAEGDYPEVLWQYADALKTGGTIDAGKPGVSVADSVAAALGCDS
jgi:hypothetical protein